MCSHCRLLGAGCFGNQHLARLLWEIVATRLHTVCLIFIWARFFFLAMWYFWHCRTQWCVCLLHAAGSGFSNGPLDLCRSGGEIGNPQKPISDALLLHTDTVAWLQAPGSDAGSRHNLPVAYPVVHYHAIAYILSFFTGHANPRSNLSNRKQIYFCKSCTFQTKIKKSIYVYEQQFICWKVQTSCSAWVQCNWEY